MQTNNGGRFRTKQNNFTMVSNDIIFNQSLTRDARILYMMIQAKITIPNFILYKTTLIKLFGANSKTFDKYWKELKDKGYLIQYKLKDESNKFYYEYELLDEPNIELSKKVQAENNPKKEEKPDPIFWGSGSLGEWKDGVYNNTDSSNTDSNNTNTTTNKEDKSLVVVDNANKDLIETNTRLKLTKYQAASVSNWDSNKLNDAVEIFNANDGRFFALLLKIYKDGAINNLKSTDRASGLSVSNKVAEFNKMDSHDWDFDEIERLERERINRMIDCKGNPTKPHAGRFDVN